MVSNREISRLFSLYAELLLLHQKNETLSGLLSGAAYRLRNFSEQVIKLDRKKLSQLFRPQVVSLLITLQKKGSIDVIDELIQLTPPGLFEMMRIRGLGGKKLAILWNVAKIDTLDGLLEACKKNRLSGIPGFGKKTQENIIKSIEDYQGNKERFHYASIADDATNLVERLQKALKTELLSLCGEIRRQTTTVAAIEILAASDPKKIKTAASRRLMIIESSSHEITRGHTLDEIPVIIYHTTKTNFYRELFRLTGSEGHVNKISKANGAAISEEAIYKKAGLPYIVPELREDLAEWDIKKRKGSLIELQDIKGVVHNHTTWSDGVDKLDDFVAACRMRGYEYTVISDHSKNAHYARGLKEEKLERQIAAIDELNKKQKRFRIFKSIECDILVSGELDFDNSILKKLDLVIVSIHQLLKMDEEKATRRLIKAIEHPYTTILGHMTGRQLLIRPGYPVNFKKVIDACAANQVIIEINANPYRLDMDWSHIPYAMKKGVMISINPDAHSISEIDNIRWGVSAARKGGLTKEMTWNALSLTEIENYLAARSKIKRKKA
jgi:DNA polymerase (family 10)